MRVLRRRRRHRDRRLGRSTFAQDRRREGPRRHGGRRRHPAAPGGAGYKYTIPLSALTQLGKMTSELDPRGRYEAVMKADGLFEVAPVN